MTIRKAVDIATKFTVKKGAYNYYLTFTLTQASLAVNLTGATIQIKVAAFNSPSVVKFTGNCSILVAANGTCQYLVQATDFNTADTYKAQLFITYPATNKFIKSDLMEIYVEEGVS